MRQRSAARPAGVSTLAVTASIDGLDGWGRLLGYLDDLAEVEAATVRRFSREEARLNLQIRGDVERLQAALGEGGWFLDEDDAAGWRLRRGGAPNGTSTL